LTPDHLVGAGQRIESAPVQYVEEYLIERLGLIR
jgi:hypothetical protein